MCWMARRCDRDAASLVGPPGGRWVGPLLLMPWASMAGGSPPLSWVAGWLDLCCRWRRRLRRLPAMSKMKPSLSDSLEASLLTPLCLLTELGLTVVVLAAVLMISDAPSVGMSSAALRTSAAGTWEGWATGDIVTESVDRPALSDLSCLISFLHCSFSFCKASKLTFNAHSSTPNDCTLCIRDDISEMDTSSIPRPPSFGFESTLSRSLLGVPLAKLNPIIMISEITVSFTRLCLRLLVPYRGKTLPTSVKVILWIVVNWSKSNWDRVSVMSFTLYRNIFEMDATQVPATSCLIFNNCVRVVITMGASLKVSTCLVIVCSWLSSASDASVGGHPWIVV